MNSNNVNPKPMTRVTRVNFSSNNRRRGKNQNKSIKINKKNFNSRENAPVSMGFRSEFSAPEMSSKGQNTTVRHREYVSDLSGSVLFSVVSTFPINPGLTVSFPWLSQIAQRFEKYRFRFLRFTFETTSPTSSVGSMMLVPDFDAEDAPPVSKSQALSYKSSVRTQIWERIALDVKMEDLHALPQYYVRGGPISGTFDIKTYDVGNLFICSSGAASAAATGELWVEYDIELFAPNIQPDNLVTGPGFYTFASSFSSNNNSLFGLQGASGNRVTKYGIGFTINSPGTLITFSSNFIGMIVVQIIGVAGDEPQDLTLEGSATSSIQTQTLDTTEFSLTAMVFINALAGQTFGCNALCVTLPLTVQTWCASYDFNALA